MVKRPVVVLIVMIVLVFSAYTEDEKEVVIGSAKELKGTTAKKITWKKDGPRWY